MFAQSVFSGKPIQSSEITVHRKLVQVLFREENPENPWGSTRTDGEGDRKKKIPVENQPWNQFSSSTAQTCPKFF